MRRRFFSVALVLLAAVAQAADAASAEVEILKRSGRVEAMLPGQKTYQKAPKRLPIGSRLRTGEDGRVALRFPDQSEVKVFENSVLVLRQKAEGRHSVGLFFGRIWSKIVRRVTGEHSFDVTTGNAVAGVRGTEFEVGVAEDGSARVRVFQGKVDVQKFDDEREAEVLLKKGQEVELNGFGEIQKPKNAETGSEAWESWFAARVLKTHQESRRIAASLKGRLDRRYGKVKALRREQARVEARLDRLTAQGAPRALRERELRRLEAIQGRLSEIEERLEVGLGMFKHWGEHLDPKTRAGMASFISDMAKIQAEFMDLVEEGTDQSEDSMEQMMEEMRGKRKTLRSKQSVKDLLF